MLDRMTSEKDSSHRMRGTPVREMGNGLTWLLDESPPCLQLRSQDPQSLHEDFATVLAQCSENDHRGAQPDAGDPEQIRPGDAPPYQHRQNVRDQGSNAGINERSIA